MQRAPLVFPSLCYVYALFWLALTVSFLYCINILPVNVIELVIDANIPFRAKQLFALIRTQI